MDSVAEAIRRYCEPRGIIECEPFPLSWLHEDDTDRREPRAARIDYFGKVNGEPDTAEPWGVVFHDADIAWHVAYAMKHNLIWVVRDAGSWYDARLQQVSIIRKERKQ